MGQVVAPASNPTTANDRCSPRSHGPCSVRTLHAGNPPIFMSDWRDMVRADLEEQERRVSLERPFAERMFFGMLVFVVLAGILLFGVLVEAVKYDAREAAFGERDH